MCCVVVCYVGEGDELWVYVLIVCCVIGVGLLFWIVLCRCFIGLVG